VRAALADGHSLTGACASAGITSNQAYVWAQQYPVFARAIAQGLAASALWWEERALELAQNGDSTAIFFGLKNRARHEWQSDTVINQFNALDMRVNQVQQINLRIDVPAVTRTKAQLPKLTHDIPEPVKVRMQR
jgi:hypothetical protein